MHVLTEAVRQYRHNDSDELVFGYDEKVTNRIVAVLQAKIDVLTRNERHLSDMLKNAGAEIEELKLMISDLQLEVEADNRNIFNAMNQIEELAKENYDLREKLEASHTDLLGVAASHDIVRATEKGMVMIPISPTVDSLVEIGPEAYKRLIAPYLSEEVSDG